MSLTAISEHAFRLLTVKRTVGNKAEFLIQQTVWSPWNRPYSLICQLFLQPKESRFCSSWRGVEACIVQGMATNSFQIQLAQTHKHLAYDLGLLPSIGICDMAGPHVIYRFEGTSPQCHTLLQLENA